MGLLLFFEDLHPTGYMLGDSRRFFPMFISLCSPKSSDLCGCRYPSFVTLSDIWFLICGPNDLLLFIYLAPDCATHDFELNVKWINWVALDTACTLAVLPLSFLVLITYTLILVAHLNSSVLLFWSDEEKQMRFVHGTGILKARYRFFGNVLLVQLPYFETEYSVIKSDLKSVFEKKSLSSRARVWVILESVLPQL
jgi:hypothetical protein